MKRVGAVEFFTATAEGQLWTPTQAWAIAKPGSKPGGPGTLDEWVLRLEPPQSSDGSSLPLHDIKRWLLFGANDKRFLQLGPKGQSQTLARRIYRDDAVVRYLKAWLERIPPERRGARISILMPAIEDATARARYLDVIGRALPENALVLPEPEMVLEYFRLVKRSLTLDANKNNVVLVVDIGAATSNLSIVQTNRDSTVTTGERGIQRAGRLRAIEGLSGDAAGRWVDEQLAKRLGIDLDGAGEDEPFDLTEIEQAKIAVSLTGREQQIAGGLPEPRPLTPQVLQEVAKEVADRLEPLLKEMTRRLWEQLTGTKASRDLWASRLKEAGVSGPEDAAKLIDVVLLAGGTSRLPGFREAVQRLIPSPHTQFQGVGDGFAAAAALGALAHVLKDKYLPPRIRAGDQGSAGAADLKLEGGLDVDIVFAWKPVREEQYETSVRVLEKGDPLIYSGGSRQNVAKIDCDADAGIRARLIPKTHDKTQRKELDPKPLRALVSQPEIGIEVSPTRVLSLRAPNLQNAAAVRLNLNRFIEDDNPQPVAARQPVSSGAVAIEQADELVIDFGMSKTIILSPTSGVLDPAEMDRLQAQLPARVAQPPPAPRLKLVSPAPSPPPVAAPAPPPVTAASPAVAASAPRATAEPRKLQPVEPRAFCTALQDFLAAADLAGIDVPRRDLVMTLLGLTVRSMVLLAGPPGCGKSMLARMIAHLLDREVGLTFHEVAVQAHWQDDAALFGEAGALKLLVGSDTPGGPHLVLFDEVNLARPEYYLTRFLHATDDHVLDKNSFRLAQSLAVGTLNIDETSRPPSPKFLDRCFLVEVDQVSADDVVRIAPPGALSKLPRLPGLLGPPSTTAPADTGLVQSLLKVLEKTVRDEGLREDLLPSRRVRNDIDRVLRLHATLGEAGEQLLARDEVLDRLIASRVLVKIAGPDEQVQPVLEVLKEFFGRAEAAKLERCQRRLKLAWKQAPLGFVSPWQ